MIKDGVAYLSILMIMMGVIVYLPKICKGKVCQKIFSIIPPVVIIYVGFMILCTLKFWDLETTKEAYLTIKNPVLYAAVFLMLLRCDMKKIIKLGPKMLLAFFSATISIGIGFVLTFMIMHGVIGNNAWGPLGALCGSWMGGTGNMLAIQAALHVEEGDMVYTLVMDTICCNIYIPFLLWVLTKSKAFNKWTKSDTRIIDEVGESLSTQAKANDKPLSWQNIALLLGIGLFMSLISQKVGGAIGAHLTFLDTATWTVLFISVVGVIFALTPIGKLKGVEEVSNVMLYFIIALIASRADIGGVKNGFAWILSGFMVMIFHVIFMVVAAKIFKLDIFSCAVASVANIGGTATAPILAGAYKESLVPVGIIMALLGNLIGTVGGLLVAYGMRVFS